MTDKKRKRPYPSAEQGAKSGRVESSARTYHAAGWDAELGGELSGQILNHLLFFSESVHVRLSFE